MCQYCAKMCQNCAKMGINYAQAIHILDIWHVYGTVCTILLQYSTIWAQFGIMKINQIFCKFFAHSRHSLAQYWHSVTWFDTIFRYNTRKLSKNFIKLCHYCVKLCQYCVSNCAIIVSNCAYIVCQIVPILCQTVRMSCQSVTISCKIVP